jgi:hypothetical protein
VLAKRSRNDAEEARTEVKMYTDNERVGVEQLVLPLRCYMTMCRTCLLHLRQVRPLPTGGAPHGHHVLSQQRGVFLTKIMACR